MSVSQFMAIKDLDNPIGCHGDLLTIIVFIHSAPGPEPSRSGASVQIDFFTSPYGTRSVGRTRDAGRRGADHPDASAGPGVRRSRSERALTIRSVRVLYQR